MLANSALNLQQNATMDRVLLLLLLLNQHSQTTQNFNDGTAAMFCMREHERTGEIIEFLFFFELAHQAQNHINFLLFLYI